MTTAITAPTPRPVAVAGETALRRVLLAGAVAGLVALQRWALRRR